MSETGLFSSDISQLRRLGALVDSVLVGANKTSDQDFRSACDELGRILDAASSRPVEDLRSLVFAELLRDYLHSAGDSVHVLRNDLGQYSIGFRTSELLEGLAKSLELERATATNRIQPMR